jgi:hypothetical protein
VRKKHRDKDDDSAFRVTRRDFIGMANAVVLGAYTGALPLVKARLPKKKEGQPMTSIRGLFAFDPTIDPDKFAAACHEWGIRQAILHPGFFRDGKMAMALRQKGIGLWLNLPVFYNPEYLEHHPENYAITSRGRRAIHDWCHFVCPSREDYLAGFVRDVRATLSILQPEIVSLDFIRHFVFWEKVNLNGDPASIEDGCYCPVCLTAFEKACGEKVNRDDAATYIRANLKHQWGDWKCKEIAGVAERILAEIRPLARNAKFAIKLVPWRESDLDGAIRSSAGQDIPVLTRNLDMAIPMAFTQVLGQTPEWKKKLLTHVRNITGKPVLSYVQTDKLIRPEEITTTQFEAELKEALGHEWAGIVVFEYQQLAANPAKAGILQKYLKRN